MSHPVLSRTAPTLIGGGGGSGRTLDSFLFACSSFIFSFCSFISSVLSSRWMYISTGICGFPQDSHLIVMGASFVKVGLFQFMPLPITVFSLRSRTQPWRWATAGSSAVQRSRLGPRAASWQDWGGLDRYMGVRIAIPSRPCRARAPSNRSPAS